MISFTCFVIFLTEDCSKCLFVEVDEGDELGLEMKLLPLGVLLQVDVVIPECLSHDGDQHVENHDLSKEGGTEEEKGHEIVLSFDPASVYVLITIRTPFEVHISKVTQKHLVLIENVFAKQRSICCIIAEHWGFLVERQCDAADLELIDAGAEHQH